MKRRWVVLLLQSRRAGSRLFDLHEGLVSDLGARQLQSRRAGSRLFDRTEMMRTLVSRDSVAIPPRGKPPLRP